MTTLKAEGVSVRRGGRLILDGASATFAGGSFAAIIGPNGAGKSTFFKMLTCEVPPTSGRIEFEGRDITGHKPRDIARGGRARGAPQPPGARRLGRACGHRGR